MQWSIRYQGSQSACCTRYLGSNCGMKGLTNMVREHLALLFHEDSWVIIGVKFPQYIVSDRLLERGYDGQQSCCCPDIKQVKLPSSVADA